MECDGVIGVLFFHTLGITHLLEKGISEKKSLFVHFKILSVWVPIARENQSEYFL